MNDESDHTRRPVHELVIDPTIFSSGRVNELVFEAKDISIGVGSYREIFSKAANEAELAGRKDEADTLQILFLLVDIRLHSENKKEPFQASIQYQNSRSPIPDDFVDKQIAEVENGIIHLVDSLLIARLYDIVWYKLRRVDAAQKAIDAYLHAAKDTRLMEMERFWQLERAMRLALQINSKQHREKCAKVFAELRADTNFNETLMVDLLSMAQTFGLMEPKLIANESKQLAESLVGNDPHRAKKLSLIASTIYSKLGEKEAAAYCHRVVAAGFLNHARKMDALSSIDFIEEGIEALRRAAAPKEEILELNKLLTTKGRESLPQMHRFESEKISTANTIKKAKEFVAGLEPLTALTKLAFQFPVLSYADHKAKVEKSIADFPLMHFIEVKNISSEGRQYSRRPAFTSSDPGELKIAFDTEIANSMAPQIEFATRYFLAPALREIRWTSTDFVSLFNVISHRPIVPTGRSEFFFSGIRAGLEGDFLDAAHILIPQIENSLRFLVAKSGKVVTTLSSENLHSEMSLNLLFDNHREAISELVESEDLTFIIESFLCKKSGENFRNELSHGLVIHPRDYRFAYTWWLAVHLLFLFTFPD